ncbi:PREDICTED: NADH dehydrogenase [ubiquinone] 1 beta subcomplex subunit 7, partial [Tinamus guttatus]|uniref:NADH dehydrogenase [ubiquinone] 1 beta subcomplex subunit 7 n=1 Tax=Tinamus guttatus TaxID=94827 RepID=UPI00052E7F05
MVAIPPPQLMVASAEQLAAAQVPLEQRDFCAHRLLLLMRCQRDAFPATPRCPRERPGQRDAFPATPRCQRERHAWDLCQHHDYVMRMK